LKANEILGLHLLTVHNIRYMTRLLATVRSAILTGQLSEAKADWLGA
jgi:tRNA-guanine family transglycosylase